MWALLVHRAGVRNCLCGSRRGAIGRGAIDSQQHRHCAMHDSTGRPHTAE